MNIWQYWEGDQPEWVTCCLRTMANVHPERKLLGREDWPRSLPYPDLGAAQAADLLRAYLLYHYGGLWVDADCVVLRSLNEILQLLEEHQAVIVKEPSGKLPCAFVASRAGSRFIGDWLDAQHRIIRRGGLKSRTALGADILRNIAEPYDDLYYLSPRKTMPIHWQRHAEFLTVRSDEEHECEIPPEALTYMLTRHVPLCHRSKGTFLNYLFRRQGIL